MRRSSFAAFIAATLILVPILQTNAAEKQYARASLEQRLPEAKLTNVALSDALQFLRDVSGANINVDWKALEAINVGKDTMVNLNLRDVRVAKVLSLVLTEAAPGNLLTYYIDGNVIEVTTREISDKQLIVVVYYVADLINGSQPFNTSGGLQLQGGGQITGGGGSGGGGGGGGGGGSSSIFGNSGGGGGNNNNAGGPNGGNNGQAEAQKLIDLIERIIRPEIWRDNGGPATIEYYNGNLIVSAPRSVQEAIGG